MDKGLGTGVGTSKDLDKTIDQLNSLLRGEISAVETYDQALEKLSTAHFVDQLRDCRQSHQNRVVMLRQQITSLGGDPSDSSGAWGSFAKLVEGGAKLFGEKAAIAALEEGEDHGLRDYRDALKKLDVSARDSVSAALLPEQERTHRVVSALKHSLH